MSSLAMRLKRPFRQLTFIEHLLCDGHCTKYLVSIILFSLILVCELGTIINLHFIKKETNKSYHIPSKQKTLGLHTWVQLTVMHVFLM